MTITTVTIKGTEHNFASDSEGLIFSKACRDHGIEIEAYTSRKTKSVEAAIADVFFAHSIDLTKAPGK